MKTKVLEEKLQDRDIYTVTQVNQYVDSLLKKDPILNDIWVRGEITGFRQYQSMHMYFSLKDEHSELSCVMFQGANMHLEFEPEEGMEVMCRGNMGIYSSRGQYQLVVREMIPKGIGKLYLAYEQLKKKLKEEGLFSDQYKKPIPLIPRKVGVATSIDGAALRDILTTIKSRFPNMDVLIAPTLVQGEGAAKEIVQAIKVLDCSDADVIIVSRGGGSIEDLWNFNEEEVARAMFEAETPIVSAVGHETDFLISDFVADMRAPTPTAAGEMVVPDKSELLERLKVEKRRALSSLQRLVIELRSRLERVVECPAFRWPEIFLEDLVQQLDYEQSRLHKNVRSLLDDFNNSFENQKKRLRALGPDSIMERGYSIVLDKDDGVIVSVEDIKSGDLVRVRMKDGEFKAKIKEVK